MAQRVTGTFSETGDSVELASPRDVVIAIDLAFEGDATVNIQWKPDGENWRTIEAITESSQRIYEGPGVPIRLNCSEYTDDVTYVMTMS